MKYPLPQHMHISIMERSCMVRPSVCRTGSGHARLMDRCLDAALVADQKEGRETGTAAGGIIRQVSA